MEFPAFFKLRLFPLEEAMKQTIKSGWSIGSGFATSEPVVVYQRLWDHIQKNDLHDITMRQGLFMGPHKVCLGDALSASGWFEGAQGGLTKTLNTITRSWTGWANSSAITARCASATLFSIAGLSARPPA